MGDAARPLLASNELIPAEWRDLYAQLAADWIREHGSLPPSIEELVEWGTQDAGVPLEAEIAYLEGKGPDPWPLSSG
jgi:hypothetical protein